jgi:hypothetical protein
MLTSQTVNGYLLALINAYVKLSIDLPHDPSVMPHPKDLDKSHPVPYGNVAKIIVLI